MNIHVKAYSTIVVEAALGDLVLSPLTGQVTMSPQDNRYRFELIGMVSKVSADFSNRQEMEEFLRSLGYYCTEAMKKLRLSEMYEGALAMADKALDEHRPGRAAAQIEKLTEELRATNATNPLLGTSIAPNKKAVHSS